jgi:hypothetical protein
MSQYFDNKELFVGPKTTQYGSHMVMTNVMKESKVKYINIDTRFRDEYNYLSVSNYNITLPERFNEVHNISVTNAEIPMTFYNISANFGNNVMKITNGSDVNVITIPDGQYSQSTLKSAMNAELTALGSPFTNVTFDISNNFSSFDPSSGTFIIDFAVDSTGGFSKYDIKSKLGWLLGFRNISYTFSSKKISEAIVDLNGPRYLYLVIDEFTKGNQNSFVSPLPMSVINKNIIARISLDPQNHGFGTILPSNNYNGLLLSDVRSYTGKIDIQKLNVQLVNEIGLPMNLNGSDFSFCIRLEHE